MNIFLVIFARELRTAFLNRLVLVFCGVSLLAGGIPVWADPGRDFSETALYALLQAGLYLIPLFAILIGVGSAQNEQEEHLLLMSQPMSRGTRVWGKFAALGFLVAGAVFLLVLPAALAGCRLGALGFLWFHIVGVGGVFLALGLGVGFSGTDRVKAHMVGLCVWLILLAGWNVLALVAAQFPDVQQWPQVWVSLLMINPLDALRISTMFSLDKIPFEVGTAPALAQWWLGHLSLWFVIVCVVWIGIALAWSRYQIERAE